MCISYNLKKLYHYKYIIMEKEKLFKVLDALAPSVEQLQEYVARKTGTTLVDVIYELPNGKHETSKSIKKNAIIKGYILDNIVLFHQIFDQFEKGYNLTIGDIRNVGAKIHPKARPISLTELKTICKHAYALTTTMQHLALQGYAPLYYLPTWFIPIDNSLQDKECIARTCDLTGFFDGASNLGSFVQTTGNFYYFCELSEL